jgi:hypothetical protein
VILTRTFSPTTSADAPPSNRCMPPFFPVIARRRLWVARSQPTACCPVRSPAGPTVTLRSEPIAEDPDASPLRREEPACDHRRDDDYQQGPWRVNHQRRCALPFHVGMNAKPAR